MAGTIATIREAGINGGFPAEIDGSLKVRYVAPLLVNMSERSTDFLKWIGGAESFMFDQTKIEWTEDDTWNRRLTHTGLAAGTTTQLVITGAAHRYPVGTILWNVPDDEYVRITGHIDANTVLIARDITSDVVEGSWASSDEVIAVGLSMNESDDYVFRPTSIMSQPYNVPQIFQTGIQASWRRQDIKLYGQLDGNDLERQSANLVAEQFVLMEGAALVGRRTAGSASVPSMFGGVKFFVTSANGAQVTSLAGAPLTRADIDNELQDLFYTVGPEKISLDLIAGAYAKRKFTSFFSGAERIQSGATTAGVAIDSFMTDFGTVNIMMHTAVAQNELYMLKKENIQMGHLGPKGRPQLQELQPSTVGPRTQKAFYADLSMIVSGVQAMVRIYNFSTSA